MGSSLENEDALLAMVMMGMDMKIQDIANDSTKAALCNAEYIMDMKVVQCNRNRKRNRKMLQLN